MAQKHLQRCLPRRCTLLCCYAVLVTTLWPLHIQGRSATGNGIRYPALLNPTFCHNG